jgi:hypothetical protein
LKAGFIGRRPQQVRRRVRGAVLTEFAVLGFVVWLLIAGVLEIGRALTVQQLLQHASRTMAREMSRLSLAADLSFTDAFQTLEFRRNVLDPGFLVIDTDLLTRCGHADFGEVGHEADLDELFRARPIGNRLLRPLMIADRRGDERMLRYPGALLLRNDTPGVDCDDGSRYGIGIAKLDSGAGTVTWHGVVESHSAPTRGFALEAGGWVGLRVNYPFQSAGLLAAEATGVSDSRTGLENQRLVDADVPLVDEGFIAMQGTLEPSDAEGGVYAGLRGLGRLYSIPDAAGSPRAVRPYRRLLSASAGFRREVFLAAAGGTL